MDEPWLWILLAVAAVLALAWWRSRGTALPHETRQAEPSKTEDTEQLSTQALEPDQVAQRLADDEAALARAESQAAEQAELLAAENRAALERAALAEAERLAREAHAHAEAQRLAAVEAAHAEAARIEAEYAEAARLEAQRMEAARLEAERADAVRRAAAEAEAARRQAEEQAAAEAARLAAQVQAAALLEAQRRAAAEEAARAEAARLEAERLEARRLEAERAEAARVLAQQAEAARLEAVRLEADRIEAARQEAARAEAQRLEAERRAAEEAARAAPPPRLAPEQTLVMVADDSKVVRVKTSRLLAQHGYRVALAEDGQAAVRLMAAEMPHVLITDVEMPGMDGFELTRHVRGHAQTAHIPIIMITSADDRLKDAAAEAGVTMLLGKPYSEDDLIACIAHAPLKITSAAADVLPA